MTQSKPLEAGSDLSEITARIQKILALGKRGGTEGEAAAAMAKAQELLAKYNLTLSQVENAADPDAKREEAKQKGGIFHYQRNLWDAVAKLNFCMYFTHGSWVLRRDGIRRKWVRHHCIVGRVVNTRSTIGMAQYLEQVIERLCHERLGVRVQELNENRPETVRVYTTQSQFFSSWAVSYREGIADRVVEKVEDRRRLAINKERNAARTANAARASGQSLSTALSIVDVTKSEEAANYDFQFGDGSHAEMMATRARRAALRAAEQARLAQLAKSNPEAYRKEAEERRKAMRRGGWGRSPRERHVGAGYGAGYEAGNKVGIDPQAASTSTARRLR